MEATDSSPRAEAARPSWRLRLFGQVLESWVRIKRDPADAASLLIPGVPVCYVIERYGLSDALILEQACREAGLPSALVPLRGVSGKRRRTSYFATSLRNSLFWNPARRRAPTEPLAQIVDALELAPDQDVQLVPVSIFVGRAPNRESGWFSVLFSENWVVVGRFRRLLALMLNGRDTHVQFSKPVSLRSVLVEEQAQPRDRTVRKIARVLRAHFRRIRSAVIGPDLSHRRTVVDAVVNAEPVREATAATAVKEALTRTQAHKRAHDYAMEIAADYSHPVVRSLSFLLSSFWNKIYGGVRMNHFDRLRAVAPGHEVIYVPCHRSHIDYLLLSWLLYNNGIVPPHIAAGVNLNLPILGPILRRGGAFFLRRSFKSNALYSAVFSEYVSQLFARGVSLEYFVEGGRSRTGRLLQPKAGMLAMTIRAFLRESRRPVVFQPVYIGYEKLMEGKSYIGELSGQPKEKESLFGLLRSVKVLRQHYGRVAVNFGEPVFLTELLDREAPTWRETGAEEKPEWFARTVDTLAERIQVNVNRAADVNPINLIAVALLATPKHSMAESDLLTQLDLYRSLLTELPYGERVTITDQTPAQIIAYAEQMQWTRRVRHPLGDVLCSDGKQGVLLSYFRNNVLHLFAAGAWIACCFINNRRMARASVVRLSRLVYPFLQAELFLPWNEDGFVERIQATIDFFVRRGIFTLDAEGRVLNRGAGQGDAAFQLRTLAHSLLQAFERYYIAIAVLVKHGPHTISAAELENLCTLTAQRLSLLHELNAPEFFDKALFKGFIQQLRERRVVWTDDAGKLDFDTALNEVAKDAKVILSREIRHGILKLAPEPKPAAAPPAPPAPPAQDEAA
jgi:glycerol-3-phosphate O-acyltransferase